MAAKESQSDHGKGAPKPETADGILWITYTNIVLYALCYQLQRPVEPYLIQSLTEQEQAQGLASSSSASSVNQTYGNLQSFFSFCQMFGSPLVGILLDRMGIRKTSCVVFVASALSYAILASASDLTLLFVSKIPTVFQAAFLVAQATAATTTGDNVAMRAAALGRMTTAYTVGATIGPALGGYLAGQGDFYVGAKLAVAGSLLSAVLSLVFLPDAVVAKDSSTKQVETKRRSFLEDTLHSGQIALRPNIWPLLSVKVIGGVCASMHSTAIPLVLTQILHFEPQQLGLVMSCGMFAVAFFGAFFMAPLTKLLGSFGMMNAGMLSRSVLGLIMAGMVLTYASVLPSSSSDSATTTNSGVSLEFVLMQVIAVTILHALSQHVLATGLTTQTTGSVDKDEQGALLGLEHSLFSLARIGGPAIGTALFGFGGVLPVELACGSIDVLTVAFLSVTLQRSSKRKDP